ncbi:S domain protein, partial [Escherichia coli PA45]
MPVVFFIVVSFRIAGDGVCTRWKKSQQVCHTPRQ